MIRDMFHFTKLSIIRFRHAEVYPITKVVTGKIENTFYPRTFTKLYVINHCISIIYNHTFNNTYS